MIEDLIIQSLNETFKKILQDSRYKKYSFRSEDLAKMLGYTDKEIKERGELLEEIKNALIMAIYGQPSSKEVEIDGKKYIEHGVENNDFILLEPENQEKEMIIVCLKNDY